MLKIHPGREDGNEQQAAVDTKRQSLKEALPMFSVSGSASWRQFRSDQWGMVFVARYGSSAVIYILQLAYLVTLFMQLLM